MDAVLGIDPAWTTRQPSGVALLVHDDDRWRCRAVAPSYDGFQSLAHRIPVDWQLSPMGGVPEPGSILDASEVLAPGTRIRVVAVDMPIARSPFSSRRPADDQASRLLGGFGCAVHSPSATCPGGLSLQLSERFALRGFQVHTTRALDCGQRPLIEVYPHPAAMSLLGRDYRVPYKAAKTTRYSPNTSVEFRVGKLLEIWSDLLEALSQTIDEVDLPLPPVTSGIRLSHLKRFEDALDALICAWVGTQFLEGRCHPLGDNDAAIWVPTLLSVPELTGL
ncbi:MAG: DUF429 domain-containing protein [Hyphomicrobiales bacterium]